MILRHPRQSARWMMDDERYRSGGELAIAAGAAAAASAVSLGLLFTVGEPFGRINDLSNAVTGVLGGCLAWRLRGQLGDASRRPALATATLGAGMTVVGSALVVSETTGFLLAGLVSSVGFAGIGAWVVALSRDAGRHWPTSLRRLGFATGSAMAIGFLALPAIAQGIDDMSTAPWWVWIALLAWLGIYVAFPLWAFRLGTAAAA
jgi:hypothetical protein